ncbi:MAG TPA: hypothetical protein VNO30_29445 [Kofleriaceae bacterium]|nr:hypothetical protein [Kofleriaceae bacterium]
MKHAVVAVSLAASLLLTLVGGASAQPGTPSTVPAQTHDVADEPPLRAPVVVPAPNGEVEQPPPHPIGSRRSEGTALLLSLGGTTVSWGLLLGGSRLFEGAAYAGGIGAVIAPSLGHWYAGTALTRGMGVRLLGTALIFGGAVVGVASFFDQLHDDNDDDNDTDTVVRDSPTAKALVISGLVLVAAGTIDDIITAPLRVRRENRARGWGVGLAPVVTQQSAGFALGGRF